MRFIKRTSEVVIALGILAMLLGLAAYHAQEPGERALGLVQRERDGRHVRVHAVGG